MLLFRKDHGKETVPETGGSMDKTAHTIAKAIVNRQGKLARCCSSRYESLSMRAKMAALLLFCFLFGGASLWFLAKGVWPERKQQRVINYSGSLPVPEPEPRDSIEHQRIHPLKK
ncbi:hypothetical protein ACMA1I_20110 [Pontibacter sp. 13R65]|uniref:hypothetical protein n=1 Tax=Pontibacter sp. 13R65 TaxID=3127458 RepID=UPI00301BB01D